MTRATLSRLPACLGTGGWLARAMPLAFRGSLNLGARCSSVATAIVAHQQYHAIRARRLCSSSAGGVNPRPQAPPPSVTIDNQTYATDSWFNIPPNVLSATSRQLHLQQDHPVAITRQILERVFPKPKFTTYNTHPPVVSTYQNFDSLGFPADHPGRSKSDTYYISRSTLLRTHTSAHQKQTFAFSNDASPGYLISADVYRRDEIDRCHYPVFHQMEGALTWDRRTVAGGDLAGAVWKDLEALPKHDIHVGDSNPAFHPKRNPLQIGHHTPSEAEAVAAHLKKSLEAMAVEIITRAREAAVASGISPQDAEQEEPLRVRWVEAYFPFTTPSWELEVFYGGDWLEVLGCGVVKQSLLVDAGTPCRVGWAFGIGLERIAMLLFNIPDIRLFWSRDERFLSQFAGLSAAVDKADFSGLRRFQPFSRFPECYKDVSFWLRSVSAAGGNTHGVGADDFHENDIMEIVREVAGDDVEDVRLVDEFTHPRTGRKSLCYRVNYRSLERTMTNEEVNAMHERVREKLVDRFRVELR
ncbi:uncharacterized protein MKZ38_008432 [Zalerion maritima]|uniref:Phenylalanine--tRNA ligase, mitochondrial n=1 Tax=Zalerion maritima TaxID=339359 RepID=A0AAD5RH53_9PEZI|nr:uncharacterized protein MKZ38_008432 [Zalerion maritima]